MMQDAAVGTVRSDGAAQADVPLEGSFAARRAAELEPPPMVFGTCELTLSELQNGRRADLLELLMRHGVKRLTAERILEIHCGDGADTGRARSHPTSRSASSLR